MHVGRRELEGVFEAGGSDGAVVAELSGLGDVLGVFVVGGEHVVCGVFAVGVLLPLLCVAPLGFVKWLGRVHVVGCFLGRRRGVSVWGMVWMWWMQPHGMVMPLPHWWVLVSGVLPREGTSYQYCHLFY